MTAPSNANTSGLAPTDALRLVPVEPTEAMLDAVKPWPEHWPPYGQATVTARAAFDIDRAVLRSNWTHMLAAAPASPLPGGGQCSETSGELDPRLVEWGYTSMDEVIAHLGKLLDNQTAFDGLAAPTGEPK